MAVALPVSHQERLARPRDWKVPLVASARPAGCCRPRPRRRSLWSRKPRTLLVPRPRPRPLPRCLHPARAARRYVRRGTLPLFPLLPCLLFLRPQAAPGARLHPSRPPLAWIVHLWSTAPAVRPMPCSLRDLHRSWAVRIRISFLRSISASPRLEQPAFLLERRRLFLLIS